MCRLGLGCLHEVGEGDGGHGEADAFGSDVVGEELGVEDDLDCAVRTRDWQRSGGGTYAGDVDTG